LTYFAPSIEYIFNLSLSQQYFLALWKQTPIVLVYKKRQQCHC
jgi:hypothetical protein